MAVAEQLSCPAIGCPRTRASMLGMRRFSRSTDPENALDLIDTSTLPGRLLVLWMIFVRVTSARGKSRVYGLPRRRVDPTGPCRSGARPGVRRLRGPERAGAR